MLNKLKAKLQALKSKPENAQDKKPEVQTELPAKQVESEKVEEALEETGTFMLTTDILKEYDDLKDLLDDV